MDGRMKTITNDERKSLSKLLDSHEYTHAISISQIDSTPGSIWTVHRDGIDRLTALDPEIKYFLVVATSQPWSEHGAGIHGHGVLRTSLTHRQIQSCFKGCNKPVVHDIYNGPRWVEYVLYKNAIIQESQLHNINGDVQ
jgi:hypothetical protein